MHFRLKLCHQKSFISWAVSYRLPEWTGPSRQWTQKHGYPGIFHRLMQISIPKSWVGHGWTWFFGDQILGCPSRGPGSGTVRWTSWDVVSPVSGFSGLGPSNSSHQRGKSVPKSHGFSCIYIYVNIMYLSNVIIIFLLYIIICSSWNCMTLSDIFWVSPPADIPRSAEFSAAQWLLE
jgi:hypothetical protein